MGGFKIFIRDNCGSMAIETALIAPLLAMLTLGSFEVGSMVARQHELQSAANEAETIVMATNLGATIDIADIEDILQESVDLKDSQISVERRYRCALANGRVKEKGSCGSADIIYEYIRVEINDSYDPTWTAWGVGKPIDYKVIRTVQVRG